MRLVRLTVAAAALAAAGLSSAPASAFTCNGPTIDTDPGGVAGVATVQVCSEGVRVIPGPNVTSAGQVGVTILGSPTCVGYHRVIVGVDGVQIPSPLIVTTCP